MQLKELLKSVGIEEIEEQFENIDIQGIANHTRKIERNYLYVAIKGFITDGHKYIEQAIENGAIALIVEEEVDNIDVPQFKVENSRKALSLLSDKYYGHPSKDMTMVGITATNGKTSTSYMLDKIFEKAKIKSGLIGSVVTKVGQEQVVSDLTTPESVDLQAFLAKMRDNGVEKVAMEVSSSALELYRVNDVDFDIVSFNNFSREHIDQHGSFEKYWQVKSSLIKEAKKDTFVILNLDDPSTSSLVDKTEGKLVTYSLTKEEGNLYCSNLTFNRGRAEFDLVINQPFYNIEGNLVKDSFRVQLGLPGYHSVANSMAAITIALVAAIEPSFIQEGLAAFRGVERRFQYIYEDDFIIIDDHFANKGNINVSLQTLEFVDYRKFHLIYGIRGNRGVTVNRENAETIAEWKDKLGIEKIIATKSIGHVTDKDKVSPEEEESFMEEMEKANIKVQMYDGLKEAIGEAIGQAGPGDILMLAGCQGMDPAGKIALDLIYEKNPSLDKEEHYKAIADRVV